MVTALRGTDWRFVLENCGRQISVAHRDSLLDWYQELLDQAFENLEGLHDIGDAPLSAARLLAQLDARETAGYYCYMVALEAGRVARYFKSDEQVPNASHDIHERLNPRGLMWNGEYEIGAWPGENDALHERALQLLSGQPRSGSMSSRDDIIGREAR